MNELQSILLVFAVLFLGFLWFSSRKNKQQHGSKSPDKAAVSVQNSSQTTTDSTSDALDALDDDAQPTAFGQLTLGDEFDLPLAAESEPLEMDELPQQEQEDVAQVGETFALLVLGRAKQLYDLDTLHQILTEQKLIKLPQNYYVFQSESGEDIVTVVNALEPGYFVEEAGVPFESPGVVLITQLPLKTLSPTLAVKQLTRLARRISQAMGGHIYDQHKNLLGQSDLQALEDKARSLEQGLQ